MNSLVPDLDNLADGHIEKVAVVRDQHERIGIVAEVVFQPIARLQIQVIGGLVQQ